MAKIIWGLKDLNYLKFSKQLLCAPQEEKEKENKYRQKQNGEPHYLKEKTGKLEKHRLWEVGCRKW